LQGRFDSVLKAANGEGEQLAQQRLTAAERALAKLIVVSFDDSAGTEFDRLRGTKKLRKIGRADLLIASIALAHQATLATRNLRHFREVPGLYVENWADP
jgi:tRNA(fMet)-specific endonuclease VapC